MTKNRIPPNSKLPDFIVKKIEARAFDMKLKKGTYKGAMVAEFGEEEYDEDDDYDNGHAFVACCYQVNDDGVAVPLRGDEDDEMNGANACEVKEANVTAAWVTRHVSDDVHADGGPL